MNRRFVSLLLILCLALPPVLAAGEAVPEEYADEAFDGTLRIREGLAQPMLAWSDLRDPDYSNEDSDILRFCVWVETDHDTDGDGKADLVRALVQVPRGAAEGKFKAAAIYDPTPYGAGTVSAYSQGGQEELYVEKPFDYAELYREGEKRVPAGEMSTLEAAADADPMDWNYVVPQQSNGAQGFSYATMYDYFLVRGFAVVECGGIGTYGNEGFELCGMDLERDSHKAVIEWLTGDRPAYSGPESDLLVRADWCNGKAAMTGTSYGGTLPFSVAVTGVKGLETIIPVAGIADWYEYTNSQGIPIMADGNYTDYLAAFNCGGTYLDDQMSVPNERYGSYLWQIATDQSASNGDYSPTWDMMTYTKDASNIRCSALVVQGMNDTNVTPRHARAMMKAFEKAGQPVKLVLHQDGHNILNGTMVNGELWEVTMNRWLTHTLYGEDNGAMEMAGVTVQSNVDGSWKTYPSWEAVSWDEWAFGTEEEPVTISTVGMADYTTRFFSDRGQPRGFPELQDDFYHSLDNDHAAVFELEFPESATLFGQAEIHVRLKTDYTDLDGMMITAVLMDTMEDGSEFEAYMTKEELSMNLPSDEIGTYDAGYGPETGTIRQYTRTPTLGKCVTFGWTDLCNPGLGEDSSLYTVSADLEAGRYYDYTFYMIPAVHTVAEGHCLRLILMAWDPCRAFLDENFDPDFTKPGTVSEYDYSFTLDTASLEARLPMAE